MKLKPAVSHRSVAVHGDGMQPATRKVPAEVPVAFVYDGSAEAVMMATPADLEDFALGFCLNERVIGSPTGLEALEILEVGRGIELRIALDAPEREGMAVRRRRHAGPAGCGLCGIESLEDALPTLPVVGAGLRLTAGEIIAAMRAMTPLQRLNAETRAVHAAGFYVRGDGIVALREDVGRHNALDKLAGAMARACRDPAAGAILVTSRLSVELVQKAAIMGSPILAAVSAPTALAIEEAEKAGITLCGIVRDDGLEMFTHAERIGLEATAHAR
ncbi:MAG: formate dehydrogenase accessory sulfurtransferase FdhD [Alphaproteobacteria bacterium]